MLLHQGFLVRRTCTSHQPLAVFAETSSHEHASSGHEQPLSRYPVRHRLLATPLSSFSTVSVQHALNCLHDCAMEPGQNEWNGLEDHSASSSTKQSRLAYVYLS